MINNGVSCETVYKKRTKFHVKHGFIFLAVKVPRETQKNNVSCETQECELLFALYKIIDI